MAQTTSGRQQNRQVFRVLRIVSVMLLIVKSYAFEFQVGGATGWTVRKDTNFYKYWAEKVRFQIGDSLLFVYAAGNDSVLHVTGDDYKNCKTGSPIEKFTNGQTVIKFNRSGPHYFISGTVDKCHQNEKLVVIVLADRSKNDNHNGTVPTPSPSPSPAPAGQESPTPPSGGVEINPTPAPSEESNSGCSFGAGGVGAIAAAGFFGSALLLGI